ncbi:MAG: xanthine dehydrogenase family protein [Candidatus Tectomicrobia bacterium]|uniref:Xanthine dehydrogenase family protein n=1 Tax=Tectimicrobiota bacterium TaxID=2528274 RepID=A0A932I044_UNCTE|nr:xanthine dehydrogenase family protein [Candidatus Tectomicrobia bacterium]
MAEAKDMGGATIGQTLPFLDAPEKAAGTATYLDDLRLPGMLTGRALRSAHARLLSVDASAARRALGVAAVLTGADFPNEIRMIGHRRGAPLIARERVRYMGDVVALVAAETAEAAEAALGLIRVAYEPLPVAEDPRAAMGPRAPKLWPEGNLLNHAKIRNGDVEEGFRLADVIVENEYQTPSIEHLYIEVESAAVAPLPGGGCTVWGSTQQPFLVRQNVARALGLKGEASVRFIQTIPGGAFGGKSEASLDVCLRAALLARAAQRPVRLVYSREESMIASSKRHAAFIRSRTGATRDGRIVAAEVEVYLDKGAYAANGGDNPPAFKRATYHALGPYQIPNVKVDVYCVHTNHPYGGQMRGPGCPQVHFAGEQQLDELARALGIDPIELRRINGLKIGSRTPWNQRLSESVGLMETLAKAEEASGWRARRGNGARRAPDGRLRGMGVASCLYGTGNAYSPAEAHIFLTADGRVRVAAGVVDFGQGSKTVLCQIAAETMDVPFGSFLMGAVDTAVDPFGGTSSSSRITMQGGKAVFQAALRARQEVLRLAGLLLEADPEDLELKGGAVRSRSHAETRLTLAEIAKAFVADKHKLLGAADSIPPAAKTDHDTGLGDPYEVYGFGTQVAEVLVDPETGEIEVTGVWAAHDVGRAISPLGVRQQIDGGVYMGVGFCLMEEIVQRGGRMLNPDMHGYLAPTVADMPRVEAIIVEDPYSNGPYGAKGAGEQVTVPTAAAIANAVYDATGVRFRRLPLAPDRVALALVKKGKDGKG